MLPNTTPQQRRALYSDIESLISPGFLSHTITIRGIRFSIRSFGPGDLFILKARAEGGLDIAWKQWAIASSVWMVDGHCILGEYNAAPRIHKMVKHLPEGLSNILFANVLGLFARTERAAEGIESYIYEDFSRSRWKMLGKSSFGSQSGVPGADKLGVNFIQQIWLAFNEVEDERLSAERQWEGFKMVASTQAPKGVKKMDQKDRQRNQDELARRQSVMDQYFYFRKGLLTREGDPKDRNLTGAVTSQHKSVSQLEEEMKRWVEGDLDHHDLIVESYKEQIRERRRKEEQEREERKAYLQQEMERREQLDLGSMPLVAYSPEQLNAILAQRRPGSSFPGARKIFDQEQFGHAQYVDKYLDKRTTPGNLQSQGGRVVDPTSNPERDSRDLQSLVQNRRVEMKGDPSMDSYVQEQRQLADRHGFDEPIDPSVFGGQRGGSR